MVIIKRVSFYGKKNQNAQIVMVRNGKTQTVHAQFAGTLPNGNKLFRTKEAANKGKAPEFVL